MAFVKKNKVSVAIIFVLAIALVMVPILSNAGAPDSNIGGYVEVDSDGDIATSPVASSLVTTESAAGTWVKQWKNIAATNNANEYRIDLKVKTNELREETTSKAITPVDVIIILDVSLSMDQNMTGEAISTRVGNPTYNDESRLTIAKNTINSFITDILDNDQLKGSRVSFATFSGRKGDYSYRDAADNDHSIKTFGTDASRWTSSPALAIAAVNRTGSDHATNMEAGFVAATELLDESKSQKPKSERVVIYVGDGDPTLHYDANGMSDGAGSPQTNPSSKNPKDISNATAAIDALKAAHSDSQLFTIGIGKDQDMAAVLQYKLSATDGSGVDKFFSATQTVEFEQAFTDIQDSITHTVKAWKVTDPMSKWVDFINFFNKNPGEITSDGGTASFTNGSITWNLKAENAIKKTEGSETVYEYALSYFVKLNTDAEGFEWDTFYPTNKITTLDFAFTTDDVGEDLTSNFLIPIVKAQDPIQRTDVDITKTVTGIDSSETFDFEVSVGGSPLNAAGNEYNVEGAVDVNGSIVTIKAGGTATIKNVPENIIVTARELGNKNYELSSVSPKGTGEGVGEVTVAIDGDNTIAFTNAYIQPNDELEGTKSSNPEDGSRVWRSDKITYTLEIKNNSDKVATGVWVRDKIPEFTEYSDMDDKYNGDHNSDYVAWFIPEIAAGDSVSLHFTVNVLDGFDWGKTINNIAYYEAIGVEYEEITPPADEDTQGEDETPSDDTTTSDATDTTEEAVNPPEENEDQDDDEDVNTKGAIIVPDILDKGPKNPTNETQHLPKAPTWTIHKTNDPGMDKGLKPGDTIEYTITVENTGVVPLMGLWVTDNIPTYTTFVSSADGNLKGPDNDKYVEWFINKVEAGDTATFKFIVKVNDGVPGGTSILNTAMGHVFDEPGLDGPPEEGMPGTPSNTVINKVETVLGQQGIPEGGDGEDGSVLGEESAPITDDEGNVLGEEAKTGDGMNAMSYIIMLLIAVAIIGVILFIRRSGKDAKEN